MKRSSSPPAPDFGALATQAQTSASRPGAEASLALAASSYVPSQLQEGENIASGSTSVSRNELEALRAFLTDEHLGKITTDTLERTLLEIGFGSETRFEKAWATQADWEELKVEVLGRGVSQTDFKLLTKLVKSKGWL